MFDPLFAEPEWLDDAAEPGPLPEVPPELLIERPVSAWDLLVQESSLADLPPAERFAAEFGPDASMSDAWLAGETSQDAAVHAQHAAVQLARMQHHLEARRIAALLVAADRSLDDLAVRFGPSFGDPNGMGAQTFSRSFGLQTKTHPKQVTREVTAGRTLRTGCRRRGRCSRPVRSRGRGHRRSSSVPTGWTPSAGPRTTRRRRRWS